MSQRYLGVNFSIKTVQNLKNVQVLELDSGSSYRQRDNSQ